MGCWLSTNVIISYQPDPDSLIAQLQQAYHRHDETIIHTLIQGMDLITMNSILQEARQNNQLRVMALIYHELDPACIQREFRIATEKQNQRAMFFWYREGGCETKTLLDLARRHHLTIVMNLFYHHQRARSIMGQMVID